MEIPGIWEYSWYDARFWERGPGEEPQTSKAEAYAAHHGTFPQMNHNFPGG
jgi:hypothetical protein